MKDKALALAARLGVTVDVDVEAGEYELIAPEYMVFASNDCQSAIGGSDDEDTLWQQVWDDLKDGVVEDDSYED